MNHDRHSPLIHHLRRLFGCKRAGHLSGRGRSTPDLDLLAPLLDCLPAAAPPPGLLVQIEERIRAERSARERRFPRMRILGVGVAGAMAGAIGVFALAPYLATEAPEKPVPLTMIEGVDRVAMLEARTLDGGRYMRIDHFGLHAPVNGSLELWLVRQGVDRPASLGLISAPSGVTVLPLAHAIVDGDVLAVSEEPAGGAPGSGPSGPVIVVARVGAGS